MVGSGQPHAPADGGVVSRAGGGQAGTPAGGHPGGRYMVLMEIYAYAMGKGEYGGQGAPMRRQLPPGKRAASKHTVLASVNPLRHGHQQNFHPQSTQQHQQPLPVGPGAWVL